MIAHACAAPIFPSFNHDTIILEILESRFVEHEAAAPPLPSTPFGFCLRYMKAYAFSLYIMIALEAGQAACAILLPYAIKQIMDAVGPDPSSVDRSLAKSPSPKLSGLHVAALDALEVEEAPPSLPRIHIRLSVEDHSSGQPTSYCNPHCVSP